uniref:Uncharacterized protein n=1 Tax=Salvator merianae TaxID=96440 RepID=A0A8D0E8D2_SALMN
MSRVPLGKVLLRNVIRHTDAHNKVGKRVVNNLNPAILDGKTKQRHPLGQGEGSASKLLQVRPQVYSRSVN